jgi:hypothetical protein
MKPCRFQRQEIQRVDILDTDYVLLMSGLSAVQRSCPDRRQLRIGGIRDEQREASKSTIFSLSLGTLHPMAFCH